MKRRKRCEYSKKKRKKIGQEEYGCRVWKSLIADLE